MNSIIRNVNLLKIPLYVSKKPTPLSVIEHLIKFPKAGSELHNVHSFPLLRSVKNLQPICDKYANKYDKNLHNSETKASLPHLLSKLTYNTNYKIRRDFSQKFSKKGRREDKRLRQADGIKGKQRDEACDKECIRVKEKRIKKKKNVEEETVDEYPKSLKNSKPEDIRTIINLNELLAQEKEEVNRISVHGRNKINNFIFKPNNCKNCQQKKGSKTDNSNSAKFNQQTRSTCSYPIIKKMYPKYEMKKREFKKHSYKEPIMSSPDKEIFAYCIDKIKEEKTKNRDNRAVHDKAKIIIDEGKSNTVPLYLIIKGLSSKPKNEEEQLTTVQHKYNNSNNFLDIHNTRKSVSDTVLHCKDSGKTNTGQKLIWKKGAAANKDKESSKVLKKKNSKTKSKDAAEKSEDFLFKHEQCTGKKSFLPVRSQEQISIEEYKEQMAHTIRRMLKPIIDQEYMNYNEVKTAIERLEENMDRYIRPKNMMFFENENIRKSPVQLFPLQQRKSEFSIPDKNHITKINRNIQEPFSKTEIKDPLSANKEKEEPPMRKKDNIIVPSFKKEEFVDPNESTALIADSCKKDDPCQRKDPCKKDDPCQKDDPCKKCDPCKKADSCQKDDPCKKEDPCLRCDPCMKADGCKKDDPCKKPDPCKKEDSCKKDPCQKKDPCKKDAPCKKADSSNKEEPCKKEDPCKQKQPCKKESPCKKPVPCSMVMEMPKPMGPSEVTCKKIQTIKKRCHCEEVKLCDLPELAPPAKCTRTSTLVKQPPPQVKGKGPDYCSQIPMPPDCPLKPDMKPKEPPGKPVPCTQRSCTARVLEPVEPPNCCKTKPGAQVEEKISVLAKKQVPCHVQEKPSRDTAPFTPVRPPARPIHVSQKKTPKKACPSPSKADVRYCKKPREEKKAERSKDERPVRGWPVAPNQEPVPPKASPLKVSKQSLKKNWTPVKIDATKLRKKELKSDSDIRQPPRLNAALPKMETTKKGMLDGCKGLFDSVCKVICPGKPKSSGKKGAAVGVAMSQSMPELRYMNQGKRSKPILLF